MYWRLTQNSEDFNKANENIKFIKFVKVNENVKFIIFKKCNY